VSTSVVDICNRALGFLGAKPINSLNDQSTSARACLLVYECARDSLLREHPWNFAIQRFMLTPDSTAPLFGKAGSYALPTGWLRLLPPDPSENLNDRDWIIEGGYILSDDTAPLHVRCVMKIDDPNLFDPSFSDALWAEMAYEMCEQLTQSNTKKEACAAAAKKAVEAAKKVNAIEKVPQVAAEDEWITKRA